jgi:DNA-binding NarL/FixJ family response regulator
MAYRILLADDQRIVIDGIRCLLRGDKEFSIVGAAESGLEVIRMARELKPDTIVMGIALPVMNGVRAARQILHRDPRINILFLTSLESEQVVMQAIRAGARGYLTKQGASADVLRNAIQTVTHGNSFLGPRIGMKLIDVFRGEAAGAPSGLEALTERERQVFQLVAEGNSSKETAAKLDLSTETVRGYRKSLMKKLGANSVARLTQIAISTGMMHFGTETKGLKQEV